MEEKMERSENSAEQNLPSPVADKARKRAMRKAEKKAKKKAEYYALSKKKKIWYWAKRIISILLIFAAIGGGTIAAVVMGTIKNIEDLYQNGPELIAAKEALAPIAPYNEDEIVRIDKMEKYSLDDTWAFYIYMSGSDLESQGMQELSSVTQYLLDNPASEIAVEKRENIDKVVGKFMSELQSQGMDLPEYMYLPESQRKKDVEDEEPDETIKGCASADIEEMMAVKLPENVKIVIQTGGSPRWSIDMVNPNRSQTFVYDSKGLREIANAPIRNMGSCETLTEFLQFCQESYPADHQGVIFWNHGSGVFGFCNDDNFAGDNISLKEMEQSFNTVFEKNAENPALEFIGFDCCLMGSVEVAECVNGYAKYLIASEELEPGMGWDYKRWLGKFVEDTSVNGVQLGRIIADSYVDYYASMDLETAEFGLSNDTTMAVLDISQAAKTYDEYKKLASTLMKDTVNYPKTIARVSSAAAESIRYGAEGYAIFNSVDLGLFMENLQESYPDGARSVLEQLKSSVMYRRASLSMSTSMGLSVYFPVDIKNANALISYLAFLDEVCDDQDIKALYYYKIGGCLNDELQAYITEKGYGNPKILDTTVFTSRTRSICLISLR